MDSNLPLSQMATTKVNNGLLGQQSMQCYLELPKPDETRGKVIMAEGDCDQ